jgi:pimeloyl-ACP methyl ester carboxylesterase
MFPTVVLLHGLARGAGSLDGMGRALRAAGFPVWACDYPSTSTSIADAADEVARRLREELPDRELCAVTHSLGGIVVRHLGDRGLDWRRIVMLAPPNRGSRVANLLAGQALFKRAYGLAGVELAEDRQWPFPPAPFAIIAGTKRRSWTNPTSYLTRFVLPDDVEHDGTVLVDETQLDGMAAFARVDANHTFIMDHPEAQRLATRFLLEGTF